MSPKVPEGAWFFPHSGHKPAKATVMWVLVPVSSCPYFCPVSFPLTRPTSLPSVLLTLHPPQTIISSTHPVCQRFPDLTLHDLQHIFWVRTPCPLGPNCTGCRNEQQAFSQQFFINNTNMCQLLFVKLTMASSLPSWISQAVGVARKRIQELQDSVVNNMVEEAWSTVGS